MGTLSGTFCELQKLGEWYIGLRHWFKELPKFCRNGPVSINKRMTLTFNNNNTAFYRQYFYIINSNKLLVLKTVLTYMTILSIQACTRDFSLHKLNIVPYPKFWGKCFHRQFERCSPHIYSLPIFLGTNYKGWCH